MTVWCHEPRRDVDHPSQLIQLNGRGRARKTSGGKELVHESPSLLFCFVTPEVRSPASLAAGLDGGQTHNPEERKDPKYHNLYYCLISVLTSCSRHRVGLPSQRNTNYNWAC